MNTKITLGNALNELSVLELEHNRLRSAEDRRHGDTDIARAKEKDSDRHIVVFATASKLFSNLSEGLSSTAKETAEPDARTADLDRLAGLIGNAAEGFDLAADIAEDLRGRDVEIREVLAGLPHAQDRADLLAVLQKLSDVLTGQKPHSG